MSGGGCAFDDGFVAEAIWRDRCRFGEGMVGGDGVVIVGKREGEEWRARGGGGEGRGGKRKIYRLECVGGGGGT